MRVVIQKVKKAKVRVNDETVAEISDGILVFAGLEKDDTEEVLDWVSNKIINLRIFEDDNGKMNLSVRDVSGDVLVVSQFTLASYIGKGNRPSFSDAMVEGEARVVFDRFVKMLEEIYPHCKTGVFRAHMEVELVNDGPVTFIIERHPKE